MKAIGTQALIFLILVATFVTLSIPPIINQIKPEATTTAIPWLATTTIPGMTTTTSGEYKLCEQLGGTCCRYLEGNPYYRGCYPGVPILERGLCPQPGCRDCPYYVCCAGPCSDASTTTISGGKCTDSDNGINPTETGTTSGINGTFTDHCTYDNNLIEYHCQLPLCSKSACVCLDPPECKSFKCPPCVSGGNVLSQEIDCSGLCENGACPSFCPENNEMLRYTYIREDRIKVELEGKKNYSCLLTFDNKGDNFDCIKDIYIDMNVNAQSGYQWDLCTKEFNMQITAANIYGDRGACTYKCEVLV